MLRMIFILLPMFCIVATAWAANPQIVAVWPDRDPGTGGRNDKVVENGTSDHPFRFVSNITVPTLTIYLPAAAAKPTSAIIICPGGGYSFLSIDSEGHEIARWLNTRGVAGIVLKYRLPNPDIKDQEPLPLHDAQQAIRLVRSQARDWNIDPAKVGIMGFSAGGHLAGMAATHFRAGDSVQSNCRPDFVILGYPVVSLVSSVSHGGSRDNLLGKGADPKLLEEYSNELHVTAQTPPTFLFHAKDDNGVPIKNSELFYEALQKAGVPSELVELTSGGHGFGLGPKGSEASKWTGMCAAWLQAQGFAPKD